MQRLVSIFSPLFLCERRELATLLLSSAAVVIYFVGIFFFPLFFFFKKKSAQPSRAIIPLAADPERSTEAAGCTDAAATGVHIIFIIIIIFIIFYIFFDTQTL